MHHFKHYIEIVALASFAMMMTVTPAVAQPKAALVKSADEQGRVPFKVNVNCPPVSSGFRCNFPQLAIPADRRFVVQYVSATIDAPTSNPGLVYLEVFASTNLVTAAPASYLGSIGTAVYRFAVSQPVTGFISAGETWDISLYVGSGGSGIAVVSGYLVDLRI
jgi:hypothetical protein